MVVEEEVLRWHGSTEFVLYWRAWRLIPTILRGRNTITSLLRSLYDVWNLHAYHDDQRLRAET